MKSSSSSVTGVYVELAELVKLEHADAHFSLLPRQPAHSVLAGQHGSHLRGRGLDFLELRAYQAGDDIRTIDWKVTARTRKPYTRVFTEERERPVLLLVDQRQTMFFGSKLNLKSVTAAEIAALAIWRVLKAKDRIGAVVFNDQEVRCFRPLRSRATGLQILKTIVEFNHALAWPKIAPSGATKINEALHKASELATHDCLVCQITDGAGMSPDTRRLNSVIAAHNDLMFAYIFDPLEVDLPGRAGLVVGDGIRQIELNRDATMRTRFHSDRGAVFEEVRRLWLGRRVPLLPVSAAEPTAPQLRRLLTIGMPAGAGR